mgnify:CR=1 FL=1
MINVLIVEDEIAISRFLRAALEGDGLRVHDAGTLQRGLIEAATRKPDLVILDLMLPGTDGFEICRRVREVKNTPIIMVSAKKEDIDKILQALYNDRYIEIDDIRRRKISVDEEERRFGVRY